MRQEDAVVRLQPKPQPRVAGDADQFRDRRPRPRAFGLRAEPFLTRALAAGLRRAAVARPPAHNCLAASRAPSTSAPSLAHAIFASLTRGPSPQSVPAIKFSRPTRWA